MKKAVIHTFFGLTTFLIICVNIVGTLEGYYKFYHEKGAEEQLGQMAVYRVLNRIVSNKPIHAFLTYSGLETGYGFFAPNVANDFIIEFDLLDENGEKLDTRHFVPLKNRESMIRVNTAYNKFLRYLDADTTNTQLCDVLLKGFALDVLKSNEGASSVTTKLFLYDPPTLVERHTRQKINPDFELIKIVSYDTADYWY